jgi:hypothetical protein
MQTPEVLVPEFECRYEPEYNDANAGVLFDELSALLPDISPPSNNNETTKLQERITDDTGDELMIDATLSQKGMNIFVSRVAGSEPIITLTRQDNDLIAHAFTTEANYKADVDTAVNQLLKGISSKELAGSL